ncbi:Pheromone receptor [Mycena kentingensis (nom. inval.)]|nr:Pheromone receptor [Mycena kentingensis (nom. inval.)]
MLDATYPLFPIASFLGFILVLIPLPWHLHAWNSGTCFYIMWSALACLNQFVNTVVWANDMLNRAPIWCDISIRLLFGTSVGIPAASLCINRRLYQIARVQAVSITAQEKRRAILVDALICVVFPLVFIAMQYVVQGHRFNIYEQAGCAPAFVNTVPTYILNFMWPPLIGCVSACYGVLSLRQFLRRRASFAQFAGASGLTTSRYLRLMALSGTDIFLTTPLGALAIYLNLATAPVQPYGTWEDVHYGFSRVVQIPAFVWQQNVPLARAVAFTQWVAPATALVFFLFFGFASEARKNYALALRAVVNAFWRVLALVGIRRPTTGIFASLPSSPTHPRSPFVGGKPKRVPRPAFVASLHSSASSVTVGKGAGMGMGSTSASPKLPPIRNSTFAAISLPLPLYANGTNAGGLTEAPSPSPVSPASSEWTTVGTGMEAVKRVESFVSTSTTRATIGGEEGMGMGMGRESRFVERLGEVYDLEMGAPPPSPLSPSPTSPPSLSLPEEDYHPHAYELQPIPTPTPTSATFTAVTFSDVDTDTDTDGPSTSASAAFPFPPSATSPPNYALPLYLAWATRPYPAVYAPEAERERERVSWAPTTTSLRSEPDMSASRPVSVSEASAGGQGRRLV